MENRFEKRKRLERKVQNGGRLSDAEFLELWNTYTPQEREKNSKRETVRQNLVLYGSISLLFATGIMAIAAEIALSVGLVYVAWHFISKFW